MAQRSNTDEEVLNEVNVIPLADLSLVLLIVLMVLSPMVTQALIHVNAARAEAAQAVPQASVQEPPVIVSFEPGLLKLNGQRMGSDLEFVKRLAQIMSNRQDRSILLTAAPAMPHGKVVYLMNLIQRQGISNLIMVKWAAPAAVGSEGIPS